MYTTSLIPAAAALEQVWDRLEAAVEIEDHPFRTFSFATVDAGGSPHARFMTLRAVERHAGRLWVHSHHRSPKVAELSANPTFAATFFDPGDVISVQARGTAACHAFDSDALAQFSRGAAAAARVTTIDLLWPGSPEALQHAITRRAFREFVAIALTIDELVWMQVQDRASCHVRFLERDAWRPEPVRD